MIHAEIHDENDKEIFRAWFRELPRVGEILWVAGTEREQIKLDHGASSFMVMQVAHWCGPGWTPNTHVGDPIHSACLYVKPV